MPLNHKNLNPQRFIQTMKQKEDCENYRNGVRRLSEKLTLAACEIECKLGAKPTPKRVGIIEIGYFNIVNETAFNQSIGN